MNKNNPKNKHSDFETTIYQGSSKKNRKKKIKNKNVQCSISTKFFKAKWDLRTLSFFWGKLSVKKKIVIFDFSFITIFSAKCFGNSIPIIKAFDFG